MKILTCLLLIFTLTPSAWGAKKSADYKPATKALSKIVYTTTLATLVKSRLTIEDAAFLSNELKRIKMHPLQPLNFKPNNDKVIDFAGLKGSFEFRRNGSELIYNGQVFSYDRDRSFEKTVKQFQKQLSTLSTTSSLFFPSAHAGFQNYCANAANNDCYDQSAFAIALSMRTISDYTYGDDEAFNKKVQSVGAMARDQQALIGQGTEALVSDIQCDKEEGSGDDYIHIRYVNGTSTKLVYSKTTDGSYTVFTKTSVPGRPTETWGMPNDHLASDMSALLNNFCGSNNVMGKRRQVIEAIRGIQGHPSVTPPRDKSGIVH